MSYFTETFDVALSKITEDKRVEFAKDVMYAGKMGALYGVVGASMAEKYPRHLIYKSTNGKVYYGKAAFDKWWADILTNERKTDEFKSLSASEKYITMQKIQKFVNTQVAKAIRSKQYDLNRIKINY